MRVYVLLLFVSVASAGFLDFFGSSTKPAKEREVKIKPQLSGRSVYGDIYETIASLLRGPSQAEETPFLPGQGRQPPTQMGFPQQPVQFPVQQPGYGASVPIRRPFEPQRRPFEPVPVNPLNQLMSAQIQYPAPPSADRNNPINPGFGERTSIRRPNQSEMRSFPPAGNSQSSRMVFPQQPFQFPEPQVENMGIRRPNAPGPFQQMGRVFGLFQGGNQLPKLTGQAQRVSNNVPTIRQ